MKTQNINKKNMIQIKNHNKICIEEHNIVSMIEIIRVRVVVDQKIKVFCFLFLELQPIKNRPTSSQGLNMQSPSLQKKKLEPIKRL